MPTIIVRHSDIQKNKYKIIEGTYAEDDGISSETKAYRALEKLLSRQPISFPEISFHIIETDFTYENEAIRKLLNKLNFDFRTQV